MDESEKLRPISEKYSVVLSAAKGVRKFTVATSSLVRIVKKRLHTVLKQSHVIGIMQYILQILQCEKRYASAGVELP